MISKARLIKIFKINFFNILVLSALIIHTFFSGRLSYWNLISIIPPLVFLLIIPLLIIINLRLKNFYGILFILASTPLILQNSDINLNFNSKPALTENSVKIFNWNTFFWEDSDKENFLNFIKSHNADIYHLQEYIYLNNENVYDLDLVKRIFPDYNIANSGEFLTLSRYPISKIYEGHSYYLKVDVDIDGKILSFYNVHIPVQLDVGVIGSPQTFIRDIDRRFYWRKENIDNLVNDITENKNLYYVSGDFNSTKSMGVMDSVLKLGTDTYSATNHLFPATWEIGQLKLWRIDYNIASQKITILDHKDINPGVYSDHWAQLVTIQLP